jgi:hypothetical protein
MLKKFAVSTIVLSVPLLVGAGTTRLFANTFYEATVTFGDRLDDNITSDFGTSGSHTYVNGGADKLETGFWLQSRDLVMRARTGPSRRYLAFSLTPITPAGAPTGSLQEHNLFMNIRDILTLPAGTGKNTIAIFTTAAGDLKFASGLVDTSQYATKVSVSRSGNVWTITADPGVSPPEPGDVAALTKMKGNTEQVLGWYHMPFQITATCPTCP